MAIRRPVAAKQVEELDDVQDVIELERQEEQELHENEVPTAQPEAKVEQFDPSTTHLILTEEEVPEHLRRVFTEEDFAPKKSNRFEEPRELTHEEKLAALDDETREQYFEFLKLMEERGKRTPEEIEIELREIAEQERQAAELEAEQVASETTDAGVSTDAEIAETGPDEEIAPDIDPSGENGTSSDNEENKKRQQHSMQQGGRPSVIASVAHAFRKSALKRRKLEFENSYLNYKRSAEDVAAKMRAADEAFLKTSAGSKIKHLAETANMSVGEYVKAAKNKTLKPNDLAEVLPLLEEAKSDPTVKNAWDSLNESAATLQMNADASAAALTKLHNGFSDVVDTDYSAAGMKKVRDDLMAQPEPLGNPEADKEFKERLEEMMKSIRDIVDRIVEKIASAFRR